MFWYISMAKSNKLDHIYDSIEGYFDDTNVDEEFFDDHMSYLDMNSDDDFEHYLDYRCTRKASRKGRGKRGSSSESSRSEVSDDGDYFQYG
ncbi:MAG: hypothetical protein ACI8UP_000128 [Porticoccaceae bacterium]